MNENFYYDMSSHVKKLMEDENSSIFYYHVEKFKQFFKPHILAASLANDKRMQGILLHREGNRLVSVATDAHHLSVMKSDLPGGAENVFELGKSGLWSLPLISVPTIRTVFGMLKNNDAVKIIMNGSHIQFEITNKIGHFTFCSALTNNDLAFPDYRNIIPGNRPDSRMPEMDKFFAVNRQSLFGSLKKLPSGKKPFDVHMTVENKQLNVNGEIMSVDMTGFEFLDVHINGRYLVNMLSFIDDEYVFFRFYDTTAPFEVRSDNDDMEKYFLTMVMRNMPNECR